MVDNLLPALETKPPIVQFKQTLGGIQTQYILAGRDGRDGGFMGRRDRGVCGAMLLGFTNLFKTVLRS